MSTWSKYFTAHTINEALAQLAADPHNSRPIAGGTDLLLEIQQGRHARVETLVDITQVPELLKLSLENGELIIGACVPIRSVAESPLVLIHATALTEACALIGGPQLRNTATLGGNVSNALPAADGMIALAALDAATEIASKGGVERRPILTLFSGPGKTSLQVGSELLTTFHIREREPGQGSAFSRIMRPQGVALPILNNAVWLERSGDRIGKIRVLFGPAGPVPVRAEVIEEHLIGRRLDAETISSVQEVVRASLNFRSSPARASSDYRYELSQLLLEDTLTRAWRRCEEGEKDIHQ